ncbi:alanyl-tRNA editing protein [Bacillus thuringiensis]|uniref:alanyl-tRNA editing protein n=1 Tax=Bacillus thuringiensis TaxID=1428 RepID=UPI000E548307|nr:alanyl-tRNA editing protein [Bacillus thuringiensis]MDZ3952348.1 alanyl-tRNA editing protein [Bacillus thuringiensis]RGP45183.1 alanyl-tRNA editing protein [Bacillus thuringiensis]
MVQKLYLQNPYLQECSATITRIEGNKIYLNQTVFYPEGGGQLGDEGWIDGYEVIDTQKTGGELFYHSDFPIIKVGTEVVHFLKEPTEELREGMEVKAKINWERRHTLMKMHSAAHLVYYFTFKIFGEMYVKGCHIAEDRARFDFYSPDNRLDRKRLDEVEKYANEIVRNNMLIENIPLQEQPEAINWICGDMSIPCGGTHVRQTGDIGKISVKRNSRGKNVERIYLYIGEGN